MAKRKDEVTFWHVIVAILAAVLGVSKGLRQGIKPPPGDRRG